MNAQIKIKNKILDIEICNTFFSRLIGFMFQRKKISIGKCFPHCNSIHTFFMFQRMDLVFCDRNMKVIKIYPAFPRNRIIWPIHQAWYTFELPLGYIHQLKVGDQIEWI